MAAAMTEPWLACTRTTCTRPWLELYGTFLPLWSSVSSPLALPGHALGEHEHEGADASIHALPDEVLLEIFLRLDTYSVGVAACVCRKWRYLSWNPTIWQRACLQVWQTTGVAGNAEIARRMFQGSWRRMWKARPRVRMDGLYVSRNTYVKQGVTDWDVKNPVHLVCYFRYFRFYGDGTFLYKTSSDMVQRAVKYFHKGARGPEARTLLHGRYRLVEDQVIAVIIYPGRQLTALVMKMRVRGRHPGCFDRMDILDILTRNVLDTDDMELACSVELQRACEGLDRVELDDPAAEVQHHERGRTSFVFVTFEQAPHSVLNLPVDKMDFFLVD
eukprot:jgi/Mesvir1/16197/Mv08459-RA.1